MRLGLGLGLFKAGAISAGVRIFSAFQTRVIGDGGTVEAGTCVVNGINGSALLQQASLLLIPSGYKGGKLYAEIPTNGNGDLTWTRGSDAFRTNASGVIQRVPWNLVGYSEDFTNSFWKIGGITTSVTANTTNAPNGTLTADTALVNSTYVYAGRAIVFQLNVGASYTLSLYVKKSSSSSADNVRLTVNNTSSWTGASTQKVALTNDWQRVTLTWTANNTQAYFIIGAVDNTGANDSTCYGNMDIWGAQFVEGTTAQTYLPTTDRLNFPRLSYMYGSCPSALLEPQRTNLALRSQEFDNASWIKNGASVTANTTTSPDGETNADTVTSSASNGFVYQTFSASAATTYTFSVWVKSVSSNVTFELNLYSNGSGLTIATSIVTATGTWQRVSVTGTYALASANAWITIGGNSSFSTGETIYVYGAQLEAGAYPTTYIPTTSATATRVADSFSRNNIYTNGLISASGGTWFVELRNNVAYTRDGFGALYLGTQSLTTSTTGDGLYIRRNDLSSNRLSIQSYISGVASALYLTATDTVKIALKWNGTSVDVFVNGTKQVSASAFTPTAMEFLGHTTIVDVPKFIQQMALFPTPLTDAQCQTLTT